MTDQDKPQFKSIYGEMVGALRGAADRAGATGYWTALQHCELCDVRASADWFLEHGSGDERFPMPSAPQWVARARQCASERNREREQATRACRLCDGTGLMPIAQDGTTRYARCECRGGPLPSKHPPVKKPEWTSTSAAVADWQERRDA